MQDINDIIQLFHKEKAVHYNIKEIRLEDDDKRWVIFVDFPKEKFVIKIAANDFTSKERIEGWVNIIEEYRSLGYYSPAIRKSRNNVYAENIVFNSNLCLVWEEEYATYYFQNDLDKSVYLDKNGEYRYYNEILAFLGKIAQKHYDFFPYKSGWVRLEPFGISETEDEVTECVKSFDMLVKEKASYGISRWEKIYFLFEENKKKLEEIYPNLPVSVFQSDHFGDNLLFNKDGHFKGVIDYNLAGMDTVINVFLYTVLFFDHHNYPNVDSHDMLPEYNPIRQNFIIEKILETLKYLRNFYTFHKEEAKAVLPLYKYISCIQYKQIEALKKYQYNKQKVMLLFDAMEYELMREEHRFYDVMLY